MFKTKVPGDSRFVTSRQTRPTQVFCFSIPRVLIPHGMLPDEIEFIILFQHFI